MDKKSSHLLVQEPDTTSEDEIHESDYDSSNFRKGEEKEPEDEDESDSECEIFIQPKKHFDPGSETELDE